MKEKLAAIFGNKVVQWFLGGSFLTLILDWTNALHTEPNVQRVAASCDTSTIGGAIAKLFGLC